MMKRIPGLVLATYLYLSCTAIAQAETIFDASFEASCGLPRKDNVSLSLTVADNTAYQLFTNGDIYAWAPEQDSYTLYAHVPASPLASINVEVPFTKQDENTRLALRGSVSQLIPAEDSLYGFNNISGMLGLIDADGWHVNAVALDVSMLRQTEDDYPIGLKSAFIANGRMYALHDIHMYEDVALQPNLLIFDLASGNCEVVPMTGVISGCRYMPGKLLCLRDDGTETPVLAVYDIADEKWTALGLTVPVSIPRSTYKSAFELNRKIDGLAYDTQRDIICFTVPKRLWRSQGGAPFQPVTTDAAADVFEHIPLAMPDYMNGSCEAWVLSSGGYVCQYGFPRYIKP